MNRKPFGEKCKCNHFESEHNVEKINSRMPQNPIKMGYLQSHPDISVVRRTSCKVCGCQMFQTTKRKWNFWSGAYK